MCSDADCETKPFKEKHSNFKSTKNPRQHPSEDCEDNLNIGSSLKDKSESQKLNQLLKSLQLGEQTAEIFSRF